MWNKPSDEELSRVPKFYSSEEVPLKEKMIYMHFFIGGCDWYAAEYSPEEKCFFGFAILNNDYEMAEWGYFSRDEFRELFPPRISLTVEDARALMAELHAKNGNRKDAKAELILTLTISEQIQYKFGKMQAMRLLQRYFPSLRSTELKSKAKNFVVE